MINEELSRKNMTLIIFSYLLGILCFSVILIFVKVPAYKEIVVAEVSAPLSNSFCVVPANKYDVLDSNTVYYLLNKQTVKIRKVIQSNKSTTSTKYILIIPNNMLQSPFSKGTNFYIYQNITLISKLKLAILKRYD